MFSVFKPSAFLEAKHVYVTPMLVDTCRDTLQGLHQTVWSALFRTSIVLRVARHLPRCPWSAQQCLPALLNSHTAHSVSDSVSDGIGCSLKRGYLGYCLVLVGFCFFGVVFGFRFFDCKGCKYATADPRPWHVYPVPVGHTCLIVPFMHGPIFTFRFLITSTFWIFN